MLFLYKNEVNSLLSQPHFCTSGGSTNHWIKPIECQIVANLDSFFSVTLLKHFCQSVSFYYGKDNINIVFIFAKKMMYDV